MIAARLAEIDKADYEDEADNVDEAIGAVDASEFKSIVYESHVMDALCEAPSVGGPARSPRRSRPRPRLRAAPRTARDGRSAAGGSG